MKIENQHFEKNSLKDANHTYKMPTSYVHIWMKIQYFFIRRMKIFTSFIKNSIKMLDALTQLSPSAYHTDPIGPVTDSWKKNFFQSPWFRPSTRVPPIWILFEAAEFEGRIFIRRILVLRSLELILV